MLKTENFKLSILIPCFNEVKYIDLILNKILKNLKEYNYQDYEVIIVDDCSIDGTIDKLKELSNNKNIKIIFHDHNQGKGAAIRSGISSITGNILIIQDADLEYDLSDYTKLLLPFF